MRLLLITVGRRPAAWAEQAAADYRRRLAPYLRLEERALPPAPGGSAPAAQLRAEEARRILAALPRDAELVALDPGGEPWSSEALARRLAAWRMASRDVALVIGGPEGLDASVLGAAALRWSLGPLTLPHALARIIVLEQLYRAASLLAGHPYHRG